MNTKVLLTVCTISLVTSTGCLIASSSNEFPSTNLNKTQGTTINETSFYDMYGLDQTALPNPNLYPPLSTPEHNPDSSVYPLILLPDHNCPIKYPAPIPLHQTPLDPIRNLQNMPPYSSSHVDHQTLIPPVKTLLSVTGQLNDYITEYQRVKSLRTSSPHPKNYQIPNFPLPPQSYQRSHPSTNSNDTFIRYPYSLQNYQNNSFSNPSTSSEPSFKNHISSKSYFSYPPHPTLSPINHVRKLNPRKVNFAVRYPLRNRMRNFVSLNTSRPDISDLRHKKLLGANDPRRFPYQRTIGKRYFSFVIQPENVLNGSCTTKSFSTSSPNEKKS